jgi:glycine cleavage system regulatory protein
MKTTLNLNEFQNAFDRMRPDNFSYEALGLLFDYFEGLDPDMELDVIAICCDFSEDHPETIAENYSINLDGVDADDITQTVTDFLERHTVVIGQTASGIVYAGF